MGELTALPRPLSWIQEAILLRFLLLMGGEGRTRKIVHPEKFLRIGPDTHLARLALSVSYFPSVLNAVYYSAVNRGAEYCDDVRISASISRQLHVPERYYHFTASIAPSVI